MALSDSEIPMLRHFFLIFFWCLGGLLAASSAGAAPTQHMAVGLEIETGRPAPGSRTTLALTMRPEAGWHGYWQNPGDAGVPTDVEWNLPKGVKIGPLRYPVPDRLLVQGLMNYVYSAPYAHLAEVRIASDIPAGTALTISGTAFWLVCSDRLCVPEQGPVQARIVVGDGAIDPTARARFDRWRSKMPRPLGAPGMFALTQGNIRIAVPMPAGAAVDAPYFFPITKDLIDYAAPQRISRRDNQLIVEVRAAKGAVRPARVSGVLRIGEDRGVAVTAVPGTVAAAGAPLIGEAGDEGGAMRRFALAMVGALVGGLLLNLMPCVFPILSLKAISLARAGETLNNARHEALAYAGGVIATCLMLGAVLLALRAGGSMVGWAFQLQDPRVILALMLLVLLIALNLAGLFELGSIGLGGRLTQGSGVVPAFWTGVLAAFVATPCTGPFMAAALGAALILPTAQAMAIFGGLGLGIAIPFLLIGFVPALRRRLPKPGGWMESFRRIMAVPMFATALGLAWILGRQAGVNGMTIGLALAMLLGLGLWWTGVRQVKGRSRVWWPSVAAILMALLSVPLIPRTGAGEAAITSADGVERFDATVLQQKVADGKSIFVYFTADWCLTCKVNEKAAIERSAVREAFRSAEVAIMVGDWTNGDPAISRFLEEQGRSGVPLYLFYSPGKPVQVLPQLLSPDLLIGLTR